MWNTKTRSIQGLIFLPQAFSTTPKHALAQATQAAGHSPFQTLDDQQIPRIYCYTYLVSVCPVVLPVLPFHLPFHCIPLSRLFSTVAGVQYSIIKLDWPTINSS